MTTRFEELAPFPDHSAELATLVGQGAGPPSLAPDAVNVPMIRHWVEAMGDHNPVYISDDGRAAGYDQSIAPPTMLQAWIMRGLRASLLLEEARAEGAVTGSGPNETMMSLLDEEGLTSVVATNCEQHYGRPLVVGDRCGALGDRGDLGPRARAWAPGASSRPGSTTWPSPTILCPGSRVRRRGAGAL